MLRVSGLIWRWEDDEGRGSNFQTWLIWADLSQTATIITNETKATGKRDF